MLIGPHHATVLDISRYNVHGQGMVLLRFCILPSTAAMEARLAPESVYGNPGKGDTVQILFMAGLAVEAKKI